MIVAAACAYTRDIIRCQAPRKLILHLLIAVVDELGGLVPRDGHCSGGCDAAIPRPHILLVLVANDVGVCARLSGLVMGEVGESAGHLWVSAVGRLALSHGYLGLDHTCTLYV